MAKKSKKRLYRVFANDKGDVFLRLEPEGIQVEIDKPVTPKTLKSAREIATKMRTDLEDAKNAWKTTDSDRAGTHRMIEAAIHPVTKGPWLSRLDYALTWLILNGLILLLSLVLLTFLYKGVQYSSTNFPEPIHRVVLLVYLCGLAALLFTIGTEENREKYRKYIIASLGSRGMLILPCLLLVTAGTVLASITFRLYNRGLIALEMCSGRPVSEAGLLDFYMWHFVNIVPTLQVTKLWRWGEPYCYTQSRIGILIFIFQLLVVIPSFNTIRFYWKNRHQPGFVYDPDWKPKSELPAEES